MKICKENFKELAESIHSYKYNYDHIEYTSQNVNVELFCPVHNTSFKTTLANHIRMKAGCKQCGIASRTLKQLGTTESFIIKAKERHGDTYSYEGSVYITARKKLLVSCKIHGAFSITPNDHLCGKGCKLCGNMKVSKSRSKDHNHFMSMLSKLDTSNYDFSGSVYTKSDEPLSVICKTHGEFNITPASIYAGCGCKLCGFVSSSKVKTLPVEDFLDKVKDRCAEYDYSKVIYKSRKYKVEIICKSCNNSFFQTPQAHLTGQGCPSCAKYGFNISIPATLYVLSGGGMIKVGITNKSYEVRLKQINRSCPSKFEVLKLYSFIDGSQALSIETNILRTLRATYQQPITKFDGSTECFYDVNLPELITQIETLTGELNGN